MRRLLPLHRRFLRRAVTKGSEKAVIPMTNRSQTIIAIIPTGQGLSALRSVSPTGQQVYETIVRRFLSIFYPPAVYQRLSLELVRKEERFFASFKVLVDQGYLKVAQVPGEKKKAGKPRKAAR